MHELNRQWIRSTSLLERVNRQLQRKFRQALTFGSPKGAEVTLYRLADQRWWETPHAHYFNLDHHYP